MLAESRTRREICTGESAWRLESAADHYSVDCGWERCLRVVLHRIARNRRSVSDFSPHLLIQRETFSPIVDIQLTCDICRT